MENHSTTTQLDSKVPGTGINPAVAKTVIIILLILYSLLTITPFYFLFIRSFVPTVESTTFYAKIPPDREFNLQAKFGSTATYYNLDVSCFKKEMGIPGYLNMNLTIEQIGNEYNIPLEKLRTYFQPFYLYNGWVNMLRSSQFFRSFIGTVLVTVFTIILACLLGSATGLGLSRANRKWQGVIYALYLAQMAIPGVIVMLPSYIIVRTLGLDNSWTVLVLIPIAGTALSTMIFTAAASNIPIALRESLVMDGGGPLLYYRKILLPLIKPAMGAYALILLPRTWNVLLPSLLYNKPEKYLLMAFISSFAGNFSTNFQAIYAGLVLALLPILVLYIGLQKMFVRAALSGAIKQ